MYEYYDAVLHAVSEGLLLARPRRAAALANDEALRLLGLPDDAGPPRRRPRPGRRLVAR